MRKLAVVVMALAVSETAAAQTPSPFKGATININVGYPVGGAPDLYFRVFARHYGRHVPGNPTIIVKNMPGAGTLRAADYIYNVAAKDGTELANFSSSATMEPLMGNPQARFDPTKFSWIGSLNQETNYCGLWQQPGTPRTFAEVLTQETVFATSGGTTSFGYQHPLIFRNFFGAKVRIVTGYRGMTQSYLAMQRGEAQALCGLVRTHIRSLWPEDVKQGRFKIVVQMGPKKTDALGPVPSIYEFLKPGQDRRVLEFHFNTKLLGRPLAGPPGMQPERLDILRKAFEQTARDPAFLADAEKSLLDIDPADHTQVEQLLAQFANYPKDVLAKASAAIAR
jgi:tripartite-type tricarboxylate transporter receptor subunit TctC